jgi:hypothetical protein
VPALDGIALLGWMSEREAIDFLQKDCSFPEPLSNEDAVTLWQEYRARVQALPERDAIAPTRRPLTRQENEIARRFKAFVYQMGGRDITDVIKIDLRGLVVHQRTIVLNKSDEYRSKVNTAEGWIRECLPSRVINTSLSGMTKREGTKTTGEIKLPHGEFFFDMNPQTGLWSVIQAMRHVTVMGFDSRMTLHAGYHRSFARIANAVPDAIESPVLVALTSATLRSSQSALAANTFLSEMRGLRPPLLSDFLNERLFIKVKLRRKRYELQIKAEVVPLDE